MDENAKIEQLELPWPIESFSDDCILFRSCHYNHRPKIQKKRRHPSEACFTLRSGEEALSFNWGKYAAAERGYIVIGLRHGKENNYISYQDYTFFQLPYKFLKSLDGIKEIAHFPDYNGNPAPVGMPNNKSHSLLYFEEDDLQIRVNLTDYCNENYDISKCNVDFKLLDLEVNSLRERLNDTDYHKLWEFNEDVNTIQN